MEIRPGKETDQEEIGKGFLLILDVMEKHPEIEPTLWDGACWSVLINGYINCGMSYDQFTKVWDEVKYHYKTWFES